MREQTGASVGAHSSTDDVGSGALFIITLSSSTAPVALEVPSLPELVGLAVFRSRRVEDGRDRFRLHVGYFESTQAAESVLPAVRQHFPAAWVGPAPKSGMGSLDDTSVAQFKFIKAPNTISNETSGRFRAPALAAPKSEGGTSTRLRALANPVQAAPPATPSTPPRAARPAPNAPAAQPRAAKPATKAPAAPARAAKPATKAPPSVKPQATPLSPSAVLNLLESAAPSPSLVSRQMAMQPRERAAVIGAIQRFAVQLVWSTDPVNLAVVPKLAIFDAYTLYKVQVDRAGRRWYGLRLGFFGDPVSARQVAIYARSDFSAAAVVPVSDRECDRAAQAAIAELPEAVVPPKVEDDMKLIDVPRTAQKSDLGATISGGKPLAASATPMAGAPAQSKPEAPPAKTETARRIKSAAELAADLEPEPSFELADGDPLNDTGVRHLAIKVVNKKKGKASKLFARGSRRADH